MSEHLVSIMIPVYNQEKYIAKAIESALNQDYENIEIVIANDNSTDNSENIIQSFLPNPKISYVKNNKTLGRVGNYHNLLYNIAKGDWVVNLDGDDFFTDSTFIRSAIQLIKSQNEENIVFLQAGHYIIYENSNKEILKLPKIDGEYQYINGIEYVLHLNDYQHFSHLATIYKREDAIKLNFYTADILSTDMESLLKLATTGNIILYKKAIGKWLQHSTNASTTSGIEKLIKNLIWIENVSNFASLHSINKKLWKKWKRKYLNLHLTGVFIHESKISKSRIDKFGLLVYFWKNYKSLFTNIYFLKKVKDAFIQK